jgi:hypothetical protein
MLRQTVEVGLLGLVEKISRVQHRVITLENTISRCRHNKVINHLHDHFNSKFR